MRVLQFLCSHLPFSEVHPFRFVDSYRSAENWIMTIPNCVIFVAKISSLFALENFPCNITTTSTALAKVSFSLQKSFYFRVIPQQVIYPQATLFDLSNIFII